MKKPTALGEQLGRIARAGGMSDGDAVRLVSHTRQALARYQLKSTYGLLNFYCNCCFHTELSDSATCYRMLDHITDIFLSDNGTAAVDIRLEVSRVLSMRTLRRQFLELYAATSLPTFLFTSLHNWSEFASQILKEIVDKPVTFPANLTGPRRTAVRGVLESMKLKTVSRPASMATKLWLSDSEAGEEGHVLWSVQTIPQWRVFDNLLFEETRDEFLSD